MKPHPDQRIHYSAEDPRYVFITPKDRSDLSEPVKQHMEERKKRIRDVLPKEEVEELMGIAEMIWGALEDYFRGKIDRPLHRFFIQLVPRIDTAVYGDVFGTVREETIEVKNLSEIQDGPLRSIQLLRIALHEAYHSTGIRRLRIDVNGDSVDVNIYSEGLRANDGIEKAGALEEGLAVYFEKNAYEGLKSRLNQAAVELHRQFQEGHNSAAQVSEQKGRSECVIVTSSSAQTSGGWNATTTIMPYTPCLNLVEFLIEQIPDFLRLVELCRVENKPLALARAIEARFGKGSFRDLLVTPMEEGNQLLERFKSKKN